MHTTFPPPPEDAVQQCREQFSADLMALYTDEEEIPSRDSGVFRYLARRHDGDPSFICVRTYQEPLTKWEIDQQRVILEGIRQTQHPYLCQVLHHRLEPHGHYVVSGPVGTVPLLEYLRRHRQVALSPLCDFVGLLAEALEGAVEARWPRCTIDAHSLLLSECTEQAIMRGVCLATPPLPGPELRGSTVAPLPTSSAAYVPDLALLVCDLLGSSARAQRFRPIAGIGALTNQLLRVVLEGQWQAHLPSARAFAQALRNTGVSEFSKATPFGTPSTSPPTDLPPSPAPSTTRPQVVASTATAVTAHVPPPIAPPNALKPLNKPSHPAPVVERLRLRPLTGSVQSTITISLAPKVTIGRVTSCDHVAQFFPRNPRNDQRSCIISREHLTLQWIDDTPVLIEPSGVNQSFVSGQPLGGKLRLGGFNRVGIAGEYDLDIHRLPSWWPIGQLWSDQTTSPSASGTMLLCPMPGTSVLDVRTLWLFSDAAFGIEQNGTLDLHPSSMRDVIGWFVRDGQSLLIVTAESDGVVRLNGLPLQALQPRPIKEGDVLRVGAVDFELATVPSSAR